MGRRKHTTENENKVFDYMTKYCLKYNLPPTIREIANGTGISSTSVVAYTIGKLVDADRVKELGTDGSPRRFIPKGMTYGYEQVADTESN